MADPLKSDWNPVPYAEKIVSILDECELHTARAALTIAENILLCGDFAKPRPNFFNAMDVVSRGEQNG